MWNLRPDDRLRWWQNFRNDLSKMPIERAIYETTHLWSYAPFVNHYLDYDSFDQWPKPWELIYENNYCDLAKALAMLYTLYLTEHRPIIDIRIFKDPKLKDIYNLVFVEDGKYVLNFIHDEIVNKEHIPNNLELLCTVSSLDLKLDNL